MADARIGLDEDPGAAVDKWLDYEEVVTSLGTVYVPRLILKDPTTGARATVNADGTQSVRVVPADAKGTDSTSRGTSGQTPTGGTVSSANGDTVIKAATTDVRAVWITNKSVVSTEVVWLRFGGGVASVGQGAPVYPGGTVILDRSPNMAITARAEAGSPAFAVAYEKD